MSALRRIQAPALERPFLTMPFPCKVALIAFGLHALVPLAASAIFRANGNEAGMAAMVWICFADPPLIPVYRAICDGRGDEGIIASLWTSFLLGGCLHAAVVTGIALATRRAFRR